MSQFRKSYLVLVEVGLEILFCLTGPGLLSSLRQCGLLRGFGGRLRPDSTVPTAIPLVVHDSQLEAEADVEILVWLEIQRDVEGAQDEHLILRTSQKGIE